MPRVEARQKEQLELSDGLILNTHSVSLLLADETKAADYRISLLFRQFFTFGDDAKSVPVRISKEKRALSPARSRAHLDFLISFLPEEWAIPMQRIGFVI